MSQTIDLTLDGLSCGHCVKRVKESLEQRPDVEQADVSITEAHVTGTASAEQLIETIKQAGYDASVSHPKAKPLAESSIPSEALTAVSEALPAATADDDDSQQLLLSGMSCASCVTRVQNALQSVPGVTQARVNLAERTALVMGSASPQDLVQAVEKAGYGAEAIEDDAKRRERQQETAVATMKRFRWQAIVALAVGIPVMVWGMIGDNMMVTADNRSLWLVIGLITLAVMVFAGGHFYRSAWKSLLNGAATMDTLVALGTGVAWLYSMSVNLWPQWFPMEARHLYYEASAMIIGLINLGHMLQARARQRSSKALEKLLDLTPPTARLVTDEGEKNVPLADVQPGMLLRLTTGDRVPVDGEITQGEAWLDEAMLTGEPIPQQKGEGDSVHAGTVVQDGSVLFRASAVGSHTTLSRIIRMVRQAQSSKPEIGQLADKISAVFVPVVVVIALVSAAIWYFFGPAPQIVYTLVIATTVLIIACPCALGLATPMSIISGVGRAAEFGVLVRDADALQRLHKAGYRLVMLTGDNPTTANAIAKEAGIDEVIAGVLPDGKAEAIKHLQSEGRQVAMVGDGINDAPALAQADVGIAMGGGSDVAIETAAITLMRHSLMGVADALAISRATLHNMKQNLLGAFIYNSIGIPVAAGILWPFTGTLLNPVVAGAAMALSSITVVSNANRLLRFKPKE